MPELAEVEFYRKQWGPGLKQPVEAIALHEQTRVFRRCEPEVLRRLLPGAWFEDSEAHGKRLLFRFRGKGNGRWLWLGIHLGMSGKLRAEERGFRPEKHDHLALFQKDRVLLFSDPRQFGWIDFAEGESAPAWWRDLPPAILSSQFTRERIDGVLDRRSRAVVKALLLDQKNFPGLGNWMVDEVLWRAEIDPARPAGSLLPEERAKLYRAVRFVCRTAMKTVGEDFSDPPSDWLFHQRWSKGGICPRTGEPLRYDSIAGRTTCWSPAVQR